MTVVRSEIRTSPGEPYPLGATVLPNGVNFSLFSKGATAVELVLFERFDDPQPSHAFSFHPHLNKTFNYWHIFVEGIGEGQIYAYRIDGPFEPAAGHRFNRKKVLLDPYSRGIVYADNWSRDEACHAEENTSSAMKSLVVDPANYDWEGVKSPNYHLSDSIIYEVHVRGFTRDPSSGVRYPGSFDGLVEKIPYLKELGITTVESKSRDRRKTDKFLGVQFDLFFCAASRILHCRLGKYGIPHRISRHGEGGASRGSGGDS